MVVCFPCRGVSRRVVAICDGLIEDKTTDTRYMCGRDHKNVASGGGIRIQSQSELGHLHYLACRGDSLNVWARRIFRTAGTQCCIADTHFRIAETDFAIADTDLDPTHSELGSQSGENRALTDFALCRHLEIMFCNLAFSHISFCLVSVSRPCLRLIITVNRHAAIPISASLGSLATWLPKLRSLSGQWEY